MRELLAFTVFWAWVRCLYMEWSYAAQSRAILKRLDRGHLKPGERVMLLSKCHELQYAAVTLQLARKGR